MNKYRITHSTCHKSGKILWFVEEYFPPPKTDEWGVVKTFTTRQAAEEYKQTLETYGKENKK